MVETVAEPVFPPATAGLRRFTTHVSVRPSVKVILSAQAPYGAGVLAGNSQPFTVGAPTGGAKVLTVVNAFPESVTSVPAGIDCAGTGCAPNWMNSARSSSRGSERSPESQAKKGRTPREPLLGSSLFRDRQTL